MASSLQHSAERPDRSWTVAQTPVAIALTLLLLAIWLLTHRYQGLSQDARLYAVQALARIQPWLADDLYLQNSSQDRYTLFSPLYAGVIRVFGLQGAERLLTLLFELGFLAAAGNAAKHLLGTGYAWLSVAGLILTVGTYGSYGVFHFSEDYLSARSAAEAMIAFAIALHLRGSSRSSLSVAVLAMLIHPLMALPGFLLLIFLMMSAPAAACLAVAGVVMTLSITLAASNLPWARSIFPLMDDDWLYIVRERAQFLFLPLWSVRDWEVNLRPFASLCLSAAVLIDARSRKICTAAALVGLSGLLVTLVGGSMGPVALLVQGQAWRWMWITVFVGVLLSLPTAARLWQDKETGPLCALLLIASWTLPTQHAACLVLAALLLFAIRRRITGTAAHYLRSSALMTAIALCGWQLIGTGSGNAIVNNIPASWLERPDVVGALRFPVAMGFLLTWHCLRTCTSRWLPAGASVALCIACVLLIPVAFAKVDREGSHAQIDEFADWRRAIPPSSTVYVANGHDAASFAWFTLQRPNYLSLDQSAGVIFSRATALEVRRRSQVLLPLMDEDWKLLARNVSSRSAAGSAPLRRSPLTAENLVSLCRDPQLGFLIAREDVGYDPIRHRQAGPWLNWNLYDCDHVRRTIPQT